MARSGILAVAVIAVIMAVTLPEGELKIINFQRFYVFFFCNLFVRAIKMIVDRDKHGA